MGLDLYYWVETRDSPRWKWKGRCPLGPRFENRDSDLLRLLGVGYQDDDWAIAPARGFPADMAEEGKAHAEAPDVVRSSWLTVQEILDFDWGRVPQHADTFIDRQNIRSKVEEAVVELLKVGEAAAVRIVFYLA